MDGASNTTGNNPGGLGQPHLTDPAPGTSPRSKKLLFTGVILAVLLIGGAVFLLSTKKADEQNAGSKNDPKASTALFDALEKAAKQEKIRVAALRKTYATNADMASMSNPGFIQSSVAEIDNPAGKYSHVFAQKLFDKDKFDMERCVQHVAYNDGLETYTGRPLPTTLAAASEYLKQMYRVTQDGGFIACKHVGVMPGLDPAFAPARMSDGIIPVTLTAPQAAQWKQKVLTANLFAVKDEGMVTRNGKQLHKYSLLPKDNRSDVNRQLYDIFYSAAEIEKVKREHPDAEWQYSFLPISYRSSGSVKGFYLVDDNLGMPVYSELQSVDADRTSGSEAAKANLGFNKQTYAYPQSLTLDLNSPLEILE